MDTDFAFAPWGLSSKAHILVSTPLPFVDFNVGINAVASPFLQHARVPRQGSLLHSQCTLEIVENLPTRLCLRNTNLHCFRACLCTPTRTSKQIPCFSVAARTCYITAPFKSCWRLCRSFQQVLSVSNIWPCSATRMPNRVSNSYSKNMCHCGFQACQKDTSGSICAGVICEDQQKDHSAFVTTGRIVPRHDKEILPQKANAAHGCIWNVLLDKHAIPQVCEGGRVSHGNYSKQHVTNGAFQLPAGCLKWRGVEPQWHFSDIRGISAQRHMSGAGMMGCWTSQTMQNVAVCFDQRLQNRCCNLCSGGSCFKCVKPMWLDSVVESQWAPFWKCQLLLSQATTAQVIPRQTRFHRFTAGLWWRNGSSCVLLPRKRTERRP